MLSTMPFTLDALRTAYAQGATPVEVIDEVLRRLNVIADPGIFIHLCSREELHAAAAALGRYDPEKPLWGIPFAVKDNIDVAGIETTAACPAYAYTPDTDAFVVAKLRAAGALMIGKTNLDQFATGLVGVRSPYPPPRNAIDSDIVPGGSSSGSAVLVAHGVVTFALGTDTAGSGRVPAALNNIVGLKPTLGTLSASGVVPACRTLDTISIFALAVDDAYAAYTVAQGFDPKDAYARAITTEPMTAPKNGLQIAVPDSTSIEFFGDAVQAETFQRDIDHLRRTGVEIVPVDFKPFFAIARLLYDGAWVAERYAVIEGLLRKTPEAVHPVTRQIVSLAETMSAADAFRGIYRLAELKRATDPILERVDMLCVPTIPTFYAVAEVAADLVTPNSNLGTYTNFVNLLDMCGIAVPTAPRSDDRPGSVTLLAPAGRDGAVAAVARSFEAGCPRTLGATSHPVPEPAALPCAHGEMIEIAVCGAHMSGLPLNRQLTDLGAAFRRQDRTAPRYRFYALAGGPPMRPGLVRTEGDGASIALEIWAVPKVSVGAFLDAIPAPLGIGSVELVNGTWVKGFLCEQAGTLGATDISDLGDWRRYLEAVETETA